MPGTENYIEHKGSRLHYLKSGHGATSLLIFHGFGQDCHAFDSWILALEDSFTLFTFDLYFHGQSFWPLREPIEKKDWKEILTQFFEREKKDKIVVAGFSLGGKFALATLEIFPDRVNKLILLAPDGIKTSMWYSLATYPVAIRTLFKSMVLRPNRFRLTVQFFKNLGLVNRGILRFAESQMDTEEKRRRVYYSWVYFRHLTFNIPAIGELINVQKIPVMMILGKYDKVIPAENMNLLLDKVDQKQVEILEAGHNDLIRASLPFLIEPFTIHS